ncbi:MAG: UbiA family prenyltransferase [Bacteroidia bacterium]|nr:UbiA family prenyltransferase [Bacteroidia bacterium]
MQATKQPFYKRFKQYLSERFPFTHILLIAAFSFSVISYSRICRGANGFVEPKTYLIAVLNAILFFYLVRVFDEFKDKEDDAKYRKELPVPRGLITLRELNLTGFVAAGLQLSFLLFFESSLLFFYVPVMAYLLLMSKEFFIADWLRKHQFWYVISHMLIIPLVDFITSSFDWYLEEVPAPQGLIFFFIVSFFNGVLLEVGRKIKAPEDEKDGVISYTDLLGIPKAIFLWCALLLANFITAVTAAWYAGFGQLMFVILILLLAIAILPAILFFKIQTTKKAKWIELVSGIWSLLMYLLLGGLPMMLNLIK